MMIYLTIAIMLLMVFFFVLFIHEKAKQKKTEGDVQLLAETIEKNSHDSSIKIQIFARLSRILASSFSRQVIFQQMITELSEYYPGDFLCLAVKTEDDSTLLIESKSIGNRKNSGNEKKLNYIKKQNFEKVISFDRIVSAAKESNFNLCLELLGTGNSFENIYAFPLLVEEKISGYFIVAKEKPIADNDYLFFTDISGLLSSVQQNILTVHEKNYISEQFGRSVDPRVRDYILSGEEEGRVLAVSVMFFDIRNFTTMSEQLGAAKSVTLLNSIFMLCDDIVRDEGGFINKFTGDGFMAVFGAPLSTPNHEKQAVRSALRILKSIGLPVGIGIASGEAVAGTIGSAKRKEYTVIGDSVNTASRVEGLCKIFGSQLLVSGSVMENASDEFFKQTGQNADITFANMQINGNNGGKNSCKNKEMFKYVRCLGKIRLKGKSEPIEIFDLMSNGGCPCIEFNAAVGLYYKKDFLQAKKALLLLSKQFPDDKAVSWFLNQCAKRQEDAAWDGVEQMTEK